METEKCRALLRSVERGSITAAAEEMGYTVSGISRMISSLEAEVGFPLLLRRRDGVTPTRRCRELLGGLRELVQQAEHCRQTAGELRGVVSGTVVIATISSVGAHRLPSVIARFRQDFPGVDFQLMMGIHEQVEEWLCTGQAEMGFLRLPTRAELDTVPLEWDELLAVLPEGHPLSAQESVTLSQLCEQPFIALDRQGRSDPDLTEAFRAESLTPPIRFTALDDYAVMSLVEHGLGVGVLPGVMLERNPYRLALRPLNPQRYRRLGAAVRRGEKLTPAAERFLSYLHAAEEGETNCGNKGEIGAVNRRGSMV